MELKQVLENWKISRVSNEHGPTIPMDFNLFNQTIGLPIHPNTHVRSQILPFQIDYFNAVNTYHKVLLNKSRKIGATETALRIILHGILTGKYSGHSIMVIAGNKQTIANKFLRRLKNIIKYGFTDLNNIDWAYDELVVDSRADHITWWDDTEIWAMPANDSVRGLDNVKCVFISEAAFIDLQDDTVVYNAVKPNIANIKDADFILESTPNGLRGFFFDLAEGAQDNKNEYHYLEQPYTVALDTLLDREFIETEKLNPTIDFEQEYMCKFTTKKGAAFREETIKYSDIPLEFHDYDKEG